MFAAIFFVLIHIRSFPLVLSIESPKMDFVKSPNHRFSTSRVSTHHDFLAFAFHKSAHDIDLSEQNGLGTYGR